MTLTEIEQNDWGNVPSGPDLVIKCHLLRKIPLQDFSIEDLRIMIGQNISLEILIPIAISRLSIDILAEGNYYPGDLLYSVLKSDAGFWRNHSQSRQQLIQLLQTKETVFENKSLDSIKAAYKEFTQLNS